jgi:hypothetical protein
MKMLERTERIPRITDIKSRRLPLSLIAGSRFSITNNSANSKPKSERFEKLCKGLIPNKKIRFIVLLKYKTIHAVHKRRCKER